MYVLEVDRARGGSTETHLVLLLAHTQSGRVSGQEEGGDAPVAQREVCVGEHQKQIRLLRVAAQTHKTTSSHMIDCKESRTKSDCKGSHLIAKNHIYCKGSNLIVEGFCKSKSEN